jgi:predicted Zn-dependent peptidase
MVFTELDDLEKVTSADVKRVLNTYLTKKNRTVAYSIQTKPEGK